MATKAPSDVSGTVWKLIAQPGDMVEAEAEIAIIESMKMEIPVIAEDSGRLKELRVEEGASVAENDVLAVVEP